MPPPKGDSRDPDRPRIAKAGSQTMPSRLIRVLAGGETGLRPGDPSLGVDVQGAHIGQVENEAAVTDAMTREAVPATPDREPDPARPSEGHAERHVDGVGGSQDQRRVTVDCRIEDLP